MKNLSLPYINDDDPHFKLKVENKTKNIFVTQNEEERDEEEENINRIPVITENSGRVLEMGVNTLQRTLVLRKKMVVDEVDRQLALKRQEFQDRMKAVEHRKAELQRKQQEKQEMVLKFEKLVQENKAKQQREHRKHQLERKQNELEKELEDLRQQLEVLESRKKYLREKVNKYRIYEDYLLRVLDLLPENYMEHGMDTLVMPIIQRHETLSITHVDLAERMEGLVEELKRRKHEIETMRQELETNRLMTKKKLSELQARWDREREKNIRLEINLQMKQGQSRERTEAMGSLLTAIRNLGEQCHLQHYGSLEDMDLLTMMDMIKEFIVEKSEVEKMAKDPGLCLPGAGGLPDIRKGKISPAKTNSKTVLKTSSKTSSKNSLASGSWA
ncbi:coiled-coil domain-containing protein 42 like-2-like [Arapaima gigas]